MEKFEIVTIDNDTEGILRKKIPDFDFSKTTKKEIKEVISAMRKIMKTSDGVGLAANQVGLEWRLFVCEYRHRFYAIFNPVITKFSVKTDVLEEGCLSVPDTYADIERPRQVTLEGQDQNGKKVKYKVDDVFARIFQHETDHLNGVLFIDYIHNS